MDKEISPKLAWTAALLLTAINTYSFADRQLPSIMIPELKADLLLTDAQIGFLFGTVFAVFFGIRVFFVDFEHFFWNSDRFFF